MCAAEPSCGGSKPTHTSTAAPGARCASCARPEPSRRGGSGRERFPPSTAPTARVTGDGRCSGVCDAGVTTAPPGWQLRTSIRWRSLRRLLRSQRRPPSAHARARARGRPATSGLFRPAPSIASPLPSRPSTDLSIPARCPGWDARSDCLRSRSAPCPAIQASFTWSSPGSSAGIATSLTSPTRAAGFAWRGRARSLRSSRRLSRKPMRCATNMAALALHSLRGRTFDGARRRRGIAFTP
jgi:hypothetical protein